MRHQLTLVLVIALAATGCQKKASGQTVAVVNNEEITASELNDALTSDQSLAGANTRDARAAELQKLIDRKLLVQQARTDGIEKSPEYLNQLRRTTDDLLINMLISRRLNTAQVPSADEINRFEASRPELFAGREIWTLSQIIYPLPKDATITAKLTAAKTLDDVAGVLTASGIEFKRDTKQLDTAVFPHQIYMQIAKVAPGEPFIAPGPDKAVANVITDRKPNPTPPDQARPLALNLMKREQANQTVQDRVKSLRASAKIQYQPGFGPPAK
jgi:peptidyl-prolyl cis-trans isomerase C